MYSIPVMKVIQNINKRSSHVSENDFQSRHLKSNGTNILKVSRVPETNQMIFLPLNPDPKPSYQLTILSQSSLFLRSKRFNVAKLIMK